MKKILTVLSVAVVLACAPLPALAKNDEKMLADLASETYDNYVEPKGVISLPEGYRASWSHLGSWVVPDEKADGYGFHDVYTQPEAVEAFRKNGEFPDGAVLVKEIRTVKTEKMTTGNASWAGDVTVWFVMVKDAKGRFGQNPNWGEGWGWALFKAGNREKNVSGDFRKDCIPCHVPARQNDWVYLRGYPTLK